MRPENSAYSDLVATPVTKPKKRGFGTTLIERSLSHDLAGEAKVEFLPDGVRAHLTAVVGGRGKTTGPE